tara:strand:+ start:1115 stop:1372 length:258 start_codon:yes stop_codon:yes gene_type:complete
MGGFKKLVDKGVKQGIIKPVLKTPEEGKKTSDALDQKLAENAEKGNEAAVALLNKRKGRKKTILTSASGLEDDDLEITKKTLLGG